MLRAFSSCGEDLGVGVAGGVCGLFVRLDCTGFCGMGEKFGDWLVRYGWNIEAVTLLAFISFIVRSVYD